MSSPRTFGVPGTATAQTGGTGSEREEDRSSLHSGGRRSETRGSTVSRVDARGVRMGEERASYGATIWMGIWESLSP